MTALIPHLDNTIRPALDRLNWWQDIVDEELRVRLQLCFGHPSYFATSSYGVVSETDPAADLSGGTGNLAVSASAPTAITTVDINPGMAVTKSGVWMRLSSIVRQISLADPTIGVANVIYLAYGLQTSTPQQNDWDEWVNAVSARYGSTPLLSGISGLITPESTYVKVDTVATYTGYNATVRADFVPIAIATVQSVVDPILGTTTILSIDHTRDNYTWNRPWFSTRDSEHRAQIGSGVQSIQNPHAVSQNEVTAGKFTPFQIALNQGMVLSKDRSVEKVPGYRCEGTYAVDQLLPDDGTMTGYPGSVYFSLRYYPNRIGKAWLTPSLAEIAALPVPGTNRVAFVGEALPAGETVHVYYTRTELCEPPAEGAITFSTNNPADGELLIAGGLALETLASTEEALSDAYQFPMAYQVYVDSEGSIRRTPQVMYCLKRLDLIGVQDVFTISQYAPGKIMMGLAGAALSPTLSVKVRVYGTNSSGSNIDQLYTFNSTNWTPFTVPSTTVPVNSLQVGTDVFAGLVNFVVEERINDGPNSSIMIWCVQTPYDSYDKLKDVALIADTTWDGLRLAKIRDRRICETTDQVNLSADSGLDLLEFVANQFAGGRQSLYREDFRRPVIHNLEHPSTWSTTSVLKDLPPWNFSKQQPGLYGAYRSRALPVMNGSGYLWRVTFLPLRLTSGTNEFVPTLPRFRFKISTGWSTWYSMSAVTGMASSYELDVAAAQAPAPPEMPVAVQLELDPFNYHSYVLYG